jgi:hypothetical protein
VRESFGDRLAGFLVDTDFDGHGLHRTGS